MKAAEGRERPALTHWPRLSAKDNKKRGGAEGERSERESENAREHIFVCSLVRSTTHQ